MLEPIRGKLSEDKFDRVDKRQLEIAEREGGRMGVSTNLGTKVNRRKRAVGTDPNIVEDVGPERSDERDQVSLKIRDTGE